LSTAIDTMTINNLTVDSDPYLSPRNLPWRRVFQIVNVNTLEITNSKFLNNQNIVLFNFFNIDRSAIYSSGKLINLIFNNITLTNNFANYTSTDTLYLSHFLLNSPLKPFQVSFNNSYFQGNKICKLPLGQSSSNIFQSKWIDFNARIISSCCDNSKLCF